MRRNWLFAGAVAVVAVLLAGLPHADPLIVQLLPSESVTDAARAEGMSTKTRALYEHRGTVPSSVQAAMQSAPQSIVVLNSGAHSELRVGEQRIEPGLIRHGATSWDEARAQTWNMPSSLPTSNEPLLWSLEKSSTKHPFVYVGEAGFVTNMARWINYAYIHLAVILGVVALSSAVVSGVVATRLRTRSAWAYTTVLFAVLVLVCLRFLLFIHSPSAWAQALDLISFYGLAGTLCGWCWVKGCRSMGETVNRQIVTLLLALIVLELVDLWVLHLGLAPLLRSVAALAPVFLALHQSTRSEQRHPERWNDVGFHSLASLLLLLEAASSLVISHISASTPMGPALALSLNGGLLHLLVIPVWLWFLRRLGQQYPLGVDPLLTDAPTASEQQVHELARRLSVHAQLHQERREAASLERQRIYRDIHDGVGSKLVALLYAVRSEKTSRATLEDAVSSSLGAMKKLLGTEETPESREILEALFAFCFEMEDLLNESSVNFSHTLQDNLPMSLLGSTTGELVQILRELVANSLKHSGALKIVVRLEITDIFLRIVLEESDYSQGEPGLEHRLRNAISSGRGSANLRQRSSDVGARLFVDPRSDRRTTQLVLRLWSAEAERSPSFEAAPQVLATTPR